MHTCCTDKTTRRRQLLLHGQNTNKITAVLRTDATRRRERRDRHNKAGGEGNKRAKIGKKKKLEIGKDNSKSLLSLLRSQR